MTWNQGLLSLVHLNFVAQKLIFGRVCVVIAG